MNKLTRSNLTTPMLTNLMLPSPLRFTRIAAGLLAAGYLNAAVAQTPSTSPTTPQTPQAALLQRLDAMQQEMAKLRAEITELKSAQTKTEATAQQANAAAQEVKQDVASSAASKPSGGPSTVVTGYGEINYNRYNNSTNAIRFFGAPDTQADARRVVLGVQHRFNEKTKFVGEFEWEHAVTSASDRGEAAIEQAYIEHQFTPNVAVRAGLFLVPLGLLNERHEPAAYYGVERNVVETAIIPSTWREGGVMAIGTFGNGFTVQGGITTGFDLSKWDSTSRDGKQSPLASIHQELSFAKAKNLSVIGALDWRGMPGLTVGGAIFTGKAGHGQLFLTGANPTITIWDLHARWTPGKWDLAAVYANGTISNTSSLNIPFVSDATPIPSRFFGGYVQAAYHVWQSGEARLSPFVRFERVNTAASYAALPNGLGRAADKTETIATIGASYQFAPSVVFKADVQRFTLNKTNNRFNLGLGWSF